MRAGAENWAAVLPDMLAHIVDQLDLMLPENLTLTWPDHVQDLVITHLRTPWPLVESGRPSYPVAELTAG